MSKVIRTGVSIEEKLLKKFDKLIEGTYSNRSEAIRDLIRNKIVEEEWLHSEGKVIGTLTLLYNHHQRGLNKKMLDIQHNYHHIFKSNLHLHLSHDFCLEVMIIEGEPLKVQQAAKSLIGLKGVKHGKLTISSRGESFK
ncbi:MAG: nickel-responsive transcriptional regulator NikR [Firmicutes bacterium]|nr:nickel-responsive transcriptional regulator NikR [Bacillota bacterium]